MEDRFVLVEWPEVQKYMGRDGFDRNACLANDPVFLEENTYIQSSAYFINESWKENVDALM